jgi:tetratricopeptide (TPR) repeat protein
MGKTEQFDRALADCTRAIELDAGLSAGYEGRALALESTGSIAAAEKDYRRALKLDPTSQTARDGLKRLASAEIGTTTSTSIKKVTVPSRTGTGSFIRRNRPP